MAFRVLRTNGYNISPDVFWHFKKDGQFGCYPGQSTETVTVMLNLYRASQVLFPGEKILNDAKTFSHKFLAEKQSANQLLDRWLITKDLPGEVEYVLNVPWYASSPRLEARYYMEQYGGEGDIWLAKTLYRMGNVCNSKYLEMAKLDYNHCQTIHQLEWSHIQKWYANLKIDESLDTRVLWSYYEAAVSIFEPERRNERVSWAKTVVLLDIISTVFARPQFTNADTQSVCRRILKPSTPSKRWKTLAHDNGCTAQNSQPNHIRNTCSSWRRHPPTPTPCCKFFFWVKCCTFYVALFQFYRTPRFRYIAYDPFSTILFYVNKNKWASWLLSWQKEVDVASGEEERIVHTIIMSGGWLTVEMLSHPQYRRLSSITNYLFHQISHKDKRTIGSQIESKMQEVVQLVLCNSLNDRLEADIFNCCQNVLLQSVL